MTGSLVVKGIARVQYVNAAAATDEWPPKYWKARSPHCPSRALLCLIAACGTRQQVIDWWHKRGHAHEIYLPAVRGLQTAGKAQPVLYALPDFTHARHLVLAQNACNECMRERAEDAAYKSTVCNRGLCKGTLHVQLI